MTPDEVQRAKETASQAFKNRLWEDTSMTESDYETWWQRFVRWIRDRFH